MKDQCLSIERMQHLRGLGLDTSKASAYWHRAVSTDTDEVIVNWFVSFTEPSQCLATMRVETIPTFTLQDILDLLPATVDDDYRLYIDKGLVLWTVGYVDAVSEEIYEDFRKKDLIDAAYEMLRWVLTNKYIQ